MLASEVTALLHGRRAAVEAAETARQTFEEGALAESLPTVTVPAAQLEAGTGVLSLFVLAGLAASNGEVRRHVQGGAVRVNDRLVSDERQLVTTADLGQAGAIKLSLGKKRHVLVKRMVNSEWSRRPFRYYHSPFTIHYLNSKIDLKIPGAMTESGLICRSGDLALPESL